MKTELTVKQLATKIVGDGKSPNKYFVTIAYGWYKPKESDNVGIEMKQADNSLDSVTVLFTSRADAEQFYDNVPMYAASIDKVTGETIGQIILEDRKNGTIKEKFIAERKNGGFAISYYH